MEINKKFLQHKNEKVRVIWTPKAACTQVVKMFLNHENLLDEAIKYHPWVHEYRAQIYQKRQIKFPKDDVRYIQFTVSPYRRVVSSYLHLSKHNLLKKNIDEEDLKLNKLCKNKFQRKIKEQDIVNISFYDFLVLIKNYSLKQNIHFKLQTFHKYKNLDIEYFKMEKIEDNYKLLKDKYNLNYKNFSSNHYIKKNDCKEFCGYTNYNDLKENIPKHYKYFYNDKIRDLVEEIYGIDIKNLNYTWDEFLNTDI